MELGEGGTRGGREGQADSGGRDVVHCIAGEEGQQPRVTHSQREGEGDFWGEGVVARDQPGELMGMDMEMEMGMGMEMAMELETETETAKKGPYRERDGPPTPSSPRRAGSRLIVGRAT